MKKTDLRYFLFISLCLLFGSYDIRPQSPSADPDLIHLGDLIDVDVIGSLEYDWRGTLTPEGFLDGLDKIEEQIYALCKSEDEVAAAVEKEYRKTLRDPKIIVKILDRSNRAIVLLDGAVKTPQRFQLKRKAYLKEILVLSGGITDKTNGEVRIFRPPNLNCADKKGGSDNAPQIVFIKIQDLLTGKPESNPQIVSGDTVTVMEASPIYLIGGVNAPKQITLRSQITLSRAIAIAGGIAKEGLEDKITIFRRNGKDSSVVEADLKKITANEAEDLILKPFDIIEIGMKGREKRKFPPILDERVLGSEKLARLPLQIIE